MTWVLILFFNSPSAFGSSIASSTVAGFRTEQECEVAGKKSGDLVDGVAFAESSFVCVKQSVYFD